MCTSSRAACQSPTSPSVQHRPLLHCCIVMLRNSPTRICSLTFTCLPDRARPHLGRRGGCTCRASSAAVAPTRSSRACSGTAAARPRPRARPPRAASRTRACCATTPATAPWSAPSRTPNSRWPTRCATRHSEWPRPRRRPHRYRAPAAALRILRLHPRARFLLPTSWCECRRNCARDQSSR